MNQSRSGPDRFVQLIEVGVFLLLILPSMMLSFFSLQQERDLSFWLIAVASMIQQAALLSLVLFFAWRNGEPFSAFGWTRRNLGNEILLGLVLYLPIAFALGFLQRALKDLGIPIPESVPRFLTPSGAPEYVLAAALFVVVAVCEEGVFRGYLIRRLANLTGQPALAVLAAAAVFCIGHGYQNLGGVIGTFVLGVIFGALLVWRGSLTAPIVVHFMQNMATILFATNR